MLMAWRPTHVNVLVREARGLGRDANAYVIFSLGSQQYRTTVKGPSCDPKWLEECTLDIEQWPREDGTGCDDADNREGAPGTTNRAQKVKAKHSLQLVLTVMHKVTLGSDKCLGKVVLMLEEVYQDKARVRPTWYALTGVRGNTAEGRAELQVTISFLRKNSPGVSGVQEDIKNGLKESMTSPRRMSLARSMSDLVSRRPAGAPLDESDAHTHRRASSESIQFTQAESKPKLSRSNSAAEGQGGDTPTSCNEKLKMRPQLGLRPPETQGRSMFRTRLWARENPMQGRQQRELVAAFTNPSMDDEKLRNLSRSDLVAQINRHKQDLAVKDDHIRSLEDYIDTLLLRVMEHTPCLLRVPYTPCSPHR